MIARTGCDPVIVRVVEDNEGLVYHILERIILPPNVDSEDILQAGRMALHRAAMKYDASRGVAFSTYACAAIFNGMLHALESDRRQRRSFRLVADSDDTATPIEIADRRNPHRNLEHAERRNLAKAALRGISHTRRQWLIAKYGPGQTPDKRLATGLSRQAGEHRATRALEEVKAWLINRPATFAALAE